MTKTIASRWSRRSMLGAALATSACGVISSPSGSEIDGRVDQALSELFTTIPGTQELADQAAGVLVMPTVTEAGFLVGGSYGEGALIIGGAKVDYFSAASASIGLQIGGQRYRHALFFMTQEALANFRQTDGWEIGLDAEYALPSNGGAVTVTSTELNKPVYAVVFGQKGLIIGASLEGLKYSRIVR